jgi:hypothetical protein
MDEVGVKGVDINAFSASQAPAKDARRPSSTC